MRNAWFWRRAGSLFPRRGAMDSGSSSRPAWAILSSPRRRPSCLSFSAATFTGISPGFRKRCSSPYGSEEAAAARVEGSLLWTHFGASGPAVLDASRFWCRARLERSEPISVSANLLPGSNDEAVDKRLLSIATERPRRKLESALGSMLPAAVAKAVVGELDLSAEVAIGQLGRDDRRRLGQALVHWPLRVLDSRGYSYAEVTSGGVPLEEIDSATMASRKCPGLYLVGEMLDVDGRIGGFNFQWAWSTGFVAGTAVVASRDQ